MENTLSSVLSQKAVRSVSRMSLRTLGKKAGLNALAVVIAAAVVFPFATLSLAGTIVAWQGYAIPKAIIAFSIVTQASRFVRIVKGRSAPVETIEGIPTAELLDHLFTHRTFRRNDIERKFGVPRYRVLDLTKNLKRVGALTTGENNMSILDPAFSRQDVASILNGKTNAKDLRPLFRRDDLGFTSRPSAEEIAKRVQDLAPLPRAPGFISRILADVSHAAEVQATCHQGATA